MSNWYLTSEGNPEFKSKKAGLVALRLVSSKLPTARLIHLRDDIEYAVVNGDIRRVYGSGAYWNDLDRPGEKEIVELFVEQDRWDRVRRILGRSPTQHEVDVATDVIQWLGTNVGNSFINEAKERFENSSKRSISS